MKYFLPTLRGYKLSMLPKDLLSGIIIAAVSIPISMGYAQISGLPAIYGLYGSVFPIIVFSLFSTSRQFIFGVDAAPAALVGTFLLTTNVTFGSPEALSLVPVITLFTALWLLIFSLLKTGKLVNYISEPVMGGFITGICCEIILMQIPKLLGGAAGHGELIELIAHIIETALNINIPSVILGCTTLVILILSKKLIPKFPTAVLVMILGALGSYYFPLKDYGITMLSTVEPGMPHFIVPSIHLYEINEILGTSLPIAIVIMAETLLAENNFALKNGYKLDDNQELLAFSLGNFVAAFTGCCPINGSVSRTSMSEQYGGQTQLTGLIAGATMILVLLFGTGFIGYLPVPVLTSIVISALLGATEFKLAAKLIKVSKKEFYIFLGAFMGVLLLGTIYGVMTGVVLSFISVILSASKPQRCFLGILPGHDEFFNMSKFKHIYPIKDVVIYKFSNNLFFANVSVFQEDIENSITPDTKAVIVNCSGIGSIDVTAAERIKIIYENLKEKNIKFYLTDHIAALNEQLIALDLGFLINEGVVRRTCTTALNDMGYYKPYTLVGADNKEHSVKRQRAENIVQEFVWAYGERAEEQIEKRIEEQLQRLSEGGTMEELMSGSWKQLGSMDEDEWLEHLEAHLSEIVKISNLSEENIAYKLEKRRIQLYNTFAKEHPELAKRFKERHDQLDENLKEQHPEVYKKIIELRKNLKDYGANN